MKMKRRPPVIAIMGHVDHGKTTLMDYIRQTTIALKEVGGITQSIRAFGIEHHAEHLVFIDTPGHEAFSKMRQRGSQVADIILLVVAADDGVKPQTKEVIDLALKDKIPMVVAINKIDLPGSDPMRVKTELATAGVLLEGWGGDTVSVEISSKTGKGVDNLLDMLNLVAELLELKEDPYNEAVVLESYLQRQSGPESLIVVKSGTFSVGDFVIGDSAYGKVRALINDSGERVSQATTSTPVRIQGLTAVLSAGEELVSAETKEKAEIAAHTRIQKKEAVTESPLPKNVAQMLEDLMKKTSEGEKPELRIILKADFAGSLEAITNALEEQSNEKVTINILKSGTGEVTESEVMTAKSSRAIIIGFNIGIPARVRSTAVKEKVVLMTYKIIYELIDDVVNAADSLIPPEIHELIKGYADIIDVFTLSNGSSVAGCIVKDGKITRGHNCFVTRSGERVAEGKITSIRHFKDEVKEVAKGMECGISIQPNFEFRKNDRITSIIIEKQ